MTLRIEAGSLMGVQIFTVSEDRQTSEMDKAFTVAKAAARTPNGPRKAAVLRGLNGKDYSLVTLWPESGRDAALHALAARDLYTVQIIDRLDGEIFSNLDERAPIFNFVNVFQVAPGKGAEMSSYFAGTIEVVRIQPGYISTNFMMSLDGSQAINIGQYATKEEFLAIFRQPSVVWEFAKGAFSGIVPYRAKVIPVLPRLRLYELCATA